MRPSLSLVLLLALPFLNGCATVRYLFQASEGQMALINHAKPIPEVVADEKTPPRIRKILAEVPEIRKYGQDQGLKPTPNYQDYVKLNRTAAVYVVSACEPLKFRAKTWDFPIVGSFPYLGWFDLSNAKEFAQGLRNEGWDADVRGARAYSTLGWFRDSILSSMIPEGEEALGEVVNTILHESVHATLYIKGQSFFDESVANFAADRMTPDYLRSTRGADSPQLKAYLESEKEGERSVRVLHETYEKLDKLYNSDLPDSEKLLEKGRILAAVKKDLGIQRDLNNATLIQYKTYNTGKEQFESLFAACGHDWKRFWKTLSKLKGESFKTPQQEDLRSVLDPLVAAGCPGD